MSDKRKCEVKRPYEAPVQGLFHQWGSRLQYGNGEQLFPVTYGIVELADGQIEEVQPDSLKFLE